MNNKIYYVKTEASDQADAIRSALVKALGIVNEGKATSIKLILSHSDLLVENGFISSAFERLFEDHGKRLFSSLKRDRLASIDGWPKETDRVGIQIILANNFTRLMNEDTLAVLIFSDYNTLKKVESALFYTEVNLIVVLNPHVEEDLKALLSATNAKVLNGQVPITEPYTNKLNTDELSILNKLSTINLGSNASNHYIRETMKSVIRELKAKKIFIPYEDFLGFMINTVKYNPTDSIALLNWKGSYFGR